VPHNGFPELGLGLTRNVNVPDEGACHRYQTEAVELLDGSPISLVAPLFVPVMFPEALLITCALVKASFGGGAEESSFWIVASP
jgi:hypothetical protein